MNKNISILNEIPGQTWERLDKQIPIKYHLNKIELGNLLPGIHLFPFLQNQDPVMYALW